MALNINPFKGSLSDTPRFEHEFLFYSSMSMLGASDAQAQMMPTVQACVHLLAGALARAKITGSTAAEDAPMLFWLRLYSDWIFYGDGYALIHRNRDGEVVNLENVRQISFHSAMGKDGQDYVVRTVKRDYDDSNHDVMDSDLIGLHWFGFDGQRSTLPTAQVAEAIKMIDLNQKYQMALTQEPTAKFNMKMDAGDDTETGRNEEDVKQVRGAIKDATGQDNPLVLADVQWDKPLTAAEVGVDDALGWAVEEIGRVFGVPAEAIGHLLRGQRSGQPTVHAFPRNVVRTRARVIEDELSLKLLRGNDREVNGARVRLDLEGIEEPSWDEKVRVIGEAVSNFGILTANEGRAKLGLPRIETEEADALRSPRGGPPMGDVAGEGADDDGE